MSLNKKHNLAILNRFFKENESAVFYKLYLLAIARKQWGFSWGVLPIPYYPLIGIMFILPEYREAASIMLLGHMAIHLAIIMGQFYYGLKCDLFNIAYAEERFDLLKYVFEGNQIEECVKKSL